jgi:hypothetical protein
MQSFEKVQLTESPADGDRGAPHGAVPPDIVRAQDAAQSEVAVETRAVLDC